jgi:hypothetical protein
MAEFLEWYGLYPKKVARKDAEKAWNKLSDQEQEEALEALPNHIKYWELKGTDKEYIPYPASWLNGYRFEDELDLTPKEIKRPVMPWYSTDELTLAKGRELGLNPSAGESYAQFRQRISAYIAKQATA